MMVQKCLFEDYENISDDSVGIFDYDVNVPFEDLGVLWLTVDKVSRTPSTVLEENAELEEYADVLKNQGDILMCDVDVCENIYYVLQRNYFCALREAHDILGSIVVDLLSFVICVLSLQAHFAVKGIHLILDIRFAPLLF